ncbi:MAG: serine acetyltransferase [Candidatus Omnitrophica bacterium]|nr:serine acetyltransferase [Candidatus Omnitrophota bacterium]
MNTEQLKETIKADLYRYSGETSSKAFLRIFFKKPGFRYTYFMRKCSFYKENGSKTKILFFKFFLARYKMKYGFSIPFECKIGKGLYLGHFGNVVVNGRSVIGRNFNIGQGVTIGQVNRGKNKGVPHIGDRVWVGPNAVIVGGIRIGNGALIGPGAYVNFDVPDNAVVIGNPGNIISFKGTEGYVRRTVSEE